MKKRKTPKIKGRDRATQREKLKGKIESKKKREKFLVSESVVEEKEKKKLYPSNPNAIIKVIQRAAEQTSSSKL